MNCFLCLCVYLTIVCRNKCRMERPGYPCMVVVFEGHTVVDNSLCQVFFWWWSAWTLLALSALPFSSTKQCYSSNTRMSTCFCMNFKICSLAIELGRVIHSFYGAQVDSATNFLMCWEETHGVIRLCHCMRKICPCSGWGIKSFPVADHCLNHCMWGSDFYY